MKLSSLTLLLVALSTVACNEKKTLVGLTAESEPNNSFSTADLLGNLANSSSIEIDGNVEFDDTQNDDLADHFLVLPTYSGQVTVTVTPVAPLANISFTEELTASTDGQVVNSAAAGLPETAQLTVTSGQALHLRVETAVASTDYTLNLSSPAPLTQGSEQTVGQLHTWILDASTGRLEQRVLPLSVLEQVPAD